jgi:hypothetical protein
MRDQVRHRVPAGSATQGRTAGQRAHLGVVAFEALQRTVGNSAAGQLRQRKAQEAELLDADARGVTAGAGTGGRARPGLRRPDRRPEGRRARAQHQRGDRRLARSDPEHAVLHAHVRALGRSPSQWKKNMSYKQLAELNQTLVDYFALLDDKAKLKELLQKSTAKP